MNLVFILPETLEETLWALPVMGQFLHSRLLGKKEDKVHVVCPVWEARDLVLSCWKGMLLDNKLCSVTRDRADLVIEFDTKRAYKLGVALEKHIRYCYGVMIGLETSVKYPPVYQPSVAEEAGSVLVVDRRPWFDEDPVMGSEVWQDSNQFLEIGKAQGIPVEIMPSTLGWKNMVNRICKASVVVGVQSSATLLAATFNKKVLELSPKNWGHRNWMAKWEMPNYRMIRCLLNELKAEEVWTSAIDLAKPTGDVLWGHHSFSQSSGDE